MTKLDLKDKKILYELDINCRQSFNQIGKKVRLSKENVFYRIKRLEEEGIIQKYSTMVNLSKLGYINFRVFIKFQNATSLIEEKIRGLLEKEKIVGWFVAIEGNWDINLWIVCKNLEELSEFWSRFNSKYQSYIAKHELSLFTNITYFSKAYLLEKKNEYKFRFVSVPKEEKLDKIELEILNVLAPNARISSVDVAEKLKISPRTVAKRIRELEKKGIIVGYKPLFDLSKLGYSYYKLHFKLHNLNKDKEKDFKNYIFEHPNIVYENEVIGGPDFEIDLQVENIEKLRNILKEIKDKFASIIQDYEVLNYIKEYKYLLFPAISH